jgi:hypothetical protein
LPKRAGAGLVRFRKLERGVRVVQICFVLSDLGDQESRIELEQDLPGLYMVVEIHVQLLDGPGNLRADID